MINYNRCTICGRFIKPNSYNACLYPRYCYEKAAIKETKPISDALNKIFNSSIDFNNDDNERTR